MSRALTGGALGATVSIMLGSRRLLALALALLGSTALLSVAEARAPKDKPTLPDEDDKPKPPTKKQIVAAFVESCSAVIDGVSSEDGQLSKVPSCQAHDSQQNCVPTICGGECEAECAPTCEKCEDKCGGACDACESKCKEGDAKCVRRCAEKRADCHGRCVDTAAGCWTATTCPAEQKCRADYDGIMADCERQACNAANECSKVPNPAECAKKVPGLSGFCARACLERGFEWVWSFEHEMKHMERSESAKPDDDSGGCPKAAHCPSDYGASVEYLAELCSGSINQVNLAEIEEAQLSPESLVMLFNSFYAFYGYDFKHETWLNDFFYGADAKTWLPPPCLAAIKKYKSEAEVPKRLAAARTRVKAVWKAATSKTP